MSRKLRYNDYFSIKVPTSQKKVELTINHASYELHSYQIVPNQSRTGLLIKIKNTALLPETTAVVKKLRKRRKDLENVDTEGDSHIWEPLYFRKL